MTRWFRMYSDVVDDPKVQRLPPALFKAWVSALCLACNNGGVIPGLADVAFKLRMKEQAAESALAALVEAGLLDRTATGLEPHNWRSRQYQSDVSTTRVKRFRERQRNVSSNVSETAPETDTESDTETEGREVKIPLPDLRASRASPGPKGTTPEGRRELWRGKVTRYVTAHAPPDELEEFAREVAANTPRGRELLDRWDRVMRRTA